MDKAPNSTERRRPHCEFDFQFPHANDTEAANEERQSRSGASISDAQIDELFNASDSDHGFADELSHETNADHADLQEAQPSPVREHDEEDGEASDGQHDQQAQEDKEAAARMSEWNWDQLDQNGTVNQDQPVNDPVQSPTRPGEEMMSPRSKKPRKSLFGGASEDEEVVPTDAVFVGMVEPAQEPVTPGFGIRGRLSSLNIDEQEHEDSPSHRPYDFGLDIPSSASSSASIQSIRAASEESVIIPPDDQAYELRQNIDRKKAYTYIDTDKSGNFDPTEEGREKARELARAKAAKAAKAAKKMQKGKKPSAKTKVMKRIVKLHFPQLHGHVRNIIDDEDNWPEDWSDIDSECEREAQEFQQYYRDNTPGREMQITIEDPRDKVDDLTGHPAARGCRSCRRHERDCSLIHGGAYPCDECKDDHIDCETIIPPMEKGPCKQCYDDGQEFCSFEDNQGQGICDHCAENDFICEPLPPVGYRAPRIRIEEMIYGEDRPHAACTVCRQEKKRCSLKKKTDKPPCKYCKKHRLGCVFFDIPKPQTKKKSKKAKGPTEGDAPEVSMPGNDLFTAEDLADVYMKDNARTSRSATPEMEMEDCHGRKGMLTKIKTCFAHPMEFNVTPSHITDCNFCEMPMFGFTGYFEREVHVIAWHSRQGFSEVGGGHCEEKGPTRMCEDCTIARLQTIVCETHDFQPLGCDLADMDPGGAADELMSAEPGSEGMKWQLTRWCSLCFSLASFGCATPGQSLRGEEESHVSGCGFRLCARCEATMSARYRGNVDLMINDLVKAPKMKEEDGMVESLEGVTRADVALLVKDGLLLRCC